MSRGVCFLLVLALLTPHGAWAQMQPHRAEYTLRLGAAVNAPRIGTAVQDITLDCTGWHIKRDVSLEIAFTPSFKVSFASKLDGEELRDGNAFHYHTIQIQNGAERDTRGKVQRSDGETHAEIVSSSGLEQLILPPLTLMPVAAISHLVDRLRGGAVSFPTLVFEPEGTGGAFLIDVKELDSGSLRPAPPASEPLAVPAKKFWPMSMTFAPTYRQDQKPLFSIHAKVFDSGVLDRLTVDTGIVTVTADLKALKMHKLPTCPTP